ncbi:2-keto-4-pentenoate hydratase [Tsukamurella pseudospumae]|uniref:2-keto-4-pentenoate hydratase n=1 Tax=Tsukamurella pseudospumae TaxID=239498 RepID=A0A137ZXV3_9ACTN|nr:fumarylacetoacetate hydrolase family protein [Tsukamurella pseudospumae]KXO98347.1 2-keto-4-pentenoate hydratase [Tsukamurella pseudospumae]KXP02969.1 2-keto-4-pentenoate hydratase [Tsukamurella pseudospumae]
MSADTITTAARRLLTATDLRSPCLPIRDLIGPTDVTAAYAVQQLLTQDRVDRGAVVVGRKIGLTNPVVQAQLGVDRPDFGVLFDDMDVTGTPIPGSMLLQPKVEAEIAFVLGEDLDGDLTLESVRRAVARSHAAIEVVDSRVAQWDISYADTVADNASAGLYVIGDRLPDAITPSAVTMTMTVNGTIASTGYGTDCLGDPLNALLWLAETARDLGDPLRAGHVVLSGALGPMVPVRPGDHVEARIGLGDETLATAVAEFALEP